MPSGSDHSKIYSPYPIGIFKEHASESKPACVICPAAARERLRGPVLSQKEVAGKCPSCRLCHQGFASLCLEVASLPSAAGCSESSREKELWVTSFPPAGTGVSAYCLGQALRWPHFQEQGNK